MMFSDSVKKSMGFGRSRGGQAGSSISRRSMMPTIMLMIALLGSFYVGGRLWQDAELRKMLVEVSERSNGQGLAALTVDDKLKLVEYKDLSKRVADLEMELISARKQGYAHNRTSAERKFKAFLGINTGFGQRSRRDAIRHNWASSGVSGLKKLQHERGLVVRFVIGRSANRGDSSDRLIDDEEREMQDFLILENHVEASEDLARKTKLYLRAAVEMWDAEFYWKVDDDAFVNLGKLEELLTSLVEKPRAYVGCMKSGEVVSDPKLRWYESDWWKFGDANVYYRHASGMMYGLSSAVAQFVAINNDVLHEYQNEDISVGSWMLGLNVEYVDERRLCCGAPPDGAICSTRPLSVAMAGAKTQARIWFYPNLVSRGITASPDCNYCSSP